MSASLKEGWKYAPNFLKMTQRPMKENGIRRTRYNNELYTIYNKLDIVKVTKIGRMRWLGQLFRVHEQKAYPVFSQNLF
jgi:hypothetical protein